MKEQEKKMSKTTRLVRAPKDILIEWNTNFPDMTHSDIIRILWKTSPLRLENYMRRRNNKII